MDIFTLAQLARKEDQRWNRLVQKSPTEEQVSKKGASLIYQMRKYKVDLYDLMIEEKTRGLADRKEEDQARGVLEAAQEAAQKSKTEKVEEKEGLEEQNRGLREKIEHLLVLTKQEETLIDTMVQKEACLRTNFEDVLGFMSVCDNVLKNELTKASKICF